MTMIGVGPSVASIMQMKKARHFCPNHIYGSEGKEPGFELAGWLDSRACALNHCTHKKEINLAINESQIHNQVMT